MSCRPVKQLQLWSKTCRAKCSQPWRAPMESASSLRVKAPRCIRRTIDWETQRRATVRAITQHVTAEQKVKWFNSMWGKPLSIFMNFRSGISGGHYVAINDYYRRRGENPRCNPRSIDWERHMNALVRVIIKLAVACYCKTGYTVAELGVWFHERKVLKQFSKYPVNGVCFGHYAVIDHWNQCSSTFAQIPKYINKFTLLFIASVPGIQRVPAEC